MRSRRIAPIMLIVSLLALGLTTVAAEPFVYESAEEIPLAYNVDVLVVGGTTGAVSAAVSAAESGATVFLAAPRPYLGDDMVATLRLSADDGWRRAESPLVGKLFDNADPDDSLRHPNSIPFTYEADQPSAGKHQDTPDAPVLTDGRWGNPNSQSVQYNGDVTLLVELGSLRPVTGLRLMAHHRDDGIAAVKYKISEIQVSAGEDGENWHPVATARQTQTERSYTTLIPLDTTARYLKVLIRKYPDAARILLGEIEVLAPVPVPPEKTTPGMLRPMHVKKVLDDALLEAGVTFLYGCFPADLLVDAAGKPCGIVMANRSGRQAVVAKTIVDATDWAVVARLAGAEFSSPPPGKRAFSRIVIGGNVRGDSPATHRTVGSIEESGSRSQRKSHEVFKYDFDLAVDDTSPAALAELEQAARDITYQPEQLRASEKLFYVPWTRIVSSVDPAAKRSFEQPLLDTFRPASTDRVFVLGACADLPLDYARRMLDAPRLIDIGAMIGKAAAGMAAELPAPDDPHLPGDERVATQAEGPKIVVRETLLGLRPTERASTLPADPRQVPVLGRYDVVVIGGGTSGSPAAIGAARQGAKVLVVEYQEGLGGIGTLGLIGHAHRGMDIGFTREVPFPDEEYDVEYKMEWYRREIRTAGGEIWLGAIGCGAVVEGNRVRGAVVATSGGRGVVLADVTIDATGNADLAAAAGARTVYGDDFGGIALQGTGLPTRPLDDGYVNTDYLLVDEADMIDVWTALVGTRQAMNAAVYDVGTLIQSRERRRIVGRHVLGYLDQVIGRTYPDTIVLSASNYDSHGYPSDPYFALLPQDEKSRKASHSAPGGSCFTPYRCLLPVELDGILVVGLGISMQRDASAMVRMQRDLQNQGYAAGVAAAMAAADGCLPSEIDVKRLQRHLVEIGNLPEEVLDDEDNFPLDTAQVAAAVGGMVDPDRLVAAKALAVILAHRRSALPLVERAFAASSGTNRLVYAKILGLFGRTEAVPTLIGALEDTAEWDDKILQGVAAEFAHLPTPVDALVLALGYAGDRRAVPAILDKLEMLDAETTLSHHRAVAVALERIGDPSAAEPLARLLEKPGMGGHAMTELEPLYSDLEKRRREGALREIVLARALFRLGDHESLAHRILHEYRQDLRGLFARHAKSVLDEADHETRDRSAF